MDAGGLTMQKRPSQHLRIVGIFCFVLFCALGFSFGAEKKGKGAASPSAPPDDRVAFHGAVVSVDKVAQGFTLQNKKARFIMLSLPVPR